MWRRSSFNCLSSNTLRIWRQGFWTCFRPIVCCYAERLITSGMKNWQRLSAVGLWSGAWNNDTTWHVAAPSTAAKINTLLFADDQVLKAGSEKSAFIAKHRKNIGVDISSKKSETLAFSGQDPLKCEIIVENKSLQKWIILNISVHIFLVKTKKKICLKRETNSKQQFYTNFGPEIIQNHLYGGEIWTVRQTDKSDWHQSRWTFSAELKDTPFLTFTNEWRNYGRLEARIIWR